ncbi:MAG TPA: SCP2 sterol-binding domain-containing protein [Polyangia bacterium]|jgi:long-chain acyl-CoA synthetase|nr:SCP2 sterol-binding domain-containing protein [Polyangia bacterium]
MGTGSNLAGTLEGLKTRFKTGIVAKKTTYYLSLGEGTGEKWTVTLTPAACDVQAGKVKDADCVLKTSADLFARLIAGTWQPGIADFLTGKIRTNDIDLLKKLQLAFGL